jgi:phosphotriesterase-related protein
MSNTSGRVMTVDGPVEPTSLGMTLTHEHLLVDLSMAPDRWGIDGMLFDVEDMITELGHFRAAGGGALVETTLPAIRRNPEGLRRIAAATGVQVVMGCGWYRQPYYPPEDAIDRRTVDDLAEQLVEEITNGVGPDRIRPGIIGEIGCHKTWMTAQEERVHRAAARAQLATGLAITTHAIASPIGLAQLDVFEQEGVDLSRVVIGHADSYPLPGYHREIARRGAWVQFDKVGDPATFFVPEDRLVRLVTELVEAGHIGQLLLSQDICFRTHLKLLGGHGYDYLPVRFLPLLRKAGLSDDDIEQLVVRNPQRMLTVR